MEDKTLVLLAWCSIPLMGVLGLLGHILLMPKRRVPAGFTFRCFGIAFTVKSGCRYFDPEMDQNCKLLEQLEKGFIYDKQ